MAKKIEVTLTLNSRSFQRQLAAATRSVNKFERSAQTGAVGTKALSSSLAPLIASGGALALLNKNFTAIDTNFKQVNTQTKTFGTAIGSVLGPAKKAQEKVGGFKGAIFSLGRGLKTGIVGIGRFIASIGRFIFSIGTAVAAVVSLASGFALLRSSLGTAAQFEDVETVLSNIFGSTAKGAIALESVTKLAEELPFAFQDLAGAAPVLATVSANLTELEENMLLAANIAANFGIPFDQAASSLQRAFSAGAGAADVFREKGVLAMAGFEAGVSVSVEETQAKLKEFGKDIEGAAKKLNEKFSGAVSQTKDALTLFNAEIGSEAMPFFQSMLTEFVVIGSLIDLGTDPNAA